MKSIHVVEPHLPFAWEKAVIACWQDGERFPTEYDKPGDPNSRDVTAVIHVTRPFDEPRIHRAFPGGLGDLERYRAEVLYGVHDHWIDPARGKWEYTYHERLFTYKIPSVGVLDQIAAAVEKLKAVPHTRRAQAVTWQAWNDLNIDDPACLQRLWFRISLPDSGQSGSDTLAGAKLHMNAHIRSNDAFKAAFMNMYAFTELQREIADRIGVEPGEYIHVADSFHIYGSYFEQFEGFLRTVRDRSPDERVYTTDFAREFFLDACHDLLDEKGMPEEKRSLVGKRLAQLVVSK